MATKNRMMMMAKPICIDCGKPLKMKAACICEDCARKNLDREELYKLLNPKGNG